MNASEAWRTRTFGLIVGAFLLLSVSYHGIIIHFVPMLTDRGVAAQSAALAMSLGAVGAVLGGVGAGCLLDRFFAPYVAAYFLCGAAVDFPAVEWGRRPRVRCHGPVGPGYGRGTKYHGLHGES